MIPLDKKHAVLGSALLGAALLLSILFLLVFPREQNRRVLFFPNGVTGELGGEIHLLPRRSEPEEAIHTFLEELILGPSTLGSVRIFPQETEIQMLMLRDRHLYVDFSPAILDVAEQMTISFDDAVEMTVYNIRYNFRFLREITLTVAGQLPGEPRFDLSIMGNNR